MRAGELKRSFTTRGRIAIGVAIGALFALGVSAGVVARFNGLDERQLAVDEYYFAQAVRFILDTGLPQFPSGGYYVRGVLPEYLAAILVLALGERGLAFRLPGALCNLLSIGLAYVYCRRFMGRLPAGGVALTLAISSWQIEFSQFARMYSAFQCITLLFLIVADEAYYRGRSNWRYLPHLLSLMAVATHFLGVLLAPLLFVPLVDGRSRERFATRRERRRFLLAGIVVVSLCCLFIGVDFRDLDVQQSRPPDYVRSLQKPSGFWSPANLLWNPHGSPQNNLALVATVLLLAGLGLVWLRRSRPDWEECDLTLLLLLVVTTAHLFVLSAALLAVLVARHGIHRWDSLRRRRRVLLVTSLLVGAAWVALAITVFSGTDRWKAICRTFLDWPQLHRSHFVPWSVSLPLLGLMLVAAVTYQWFSKARKPIDALVRNPTFVVLWVFACQAVLRPTYDELRYVFFIYPVILCVIALAVSDLAVLTLGRGERASVAAFCVYVGVFALSSDFNPRHMLNMSDPRVVFRQSEYERFATLWYSRKDFASPAAFLRTAVDAGEDRIVVVDQPPVSYYLDQRHAVYYDRSTRRFSNVSREHGTTDLWSNLPLLGTPEDLRRYTAGASTVWLVQSHDRRERSFDPDDVWGSRLVGASGEYVGEDGALEVVRVTLADTPNAVR